MCVFVLKEKISIIRSTHNFVLHRVFLFMFVCILLVGNTLSTAKFKIIFLHISNKTNTYNRILNRLPSFWKKMFFSATNQCQCNPTWCETAIFHRAEPVVTTVVVRCLSSDTYRITCTADHTSITSTLAEENNCHDVGHHMTPLNSTIINTSPSSNNTFLTAVLLHWTNSAGVFAVMLIHN